MKRELLGYADVDSGQLCVVDPCYVLDDERYTALIDQWDTTGAKSKDGKHAVPLRSNYATGVNFNTAWGDGSYAVYGEIEDGRVVRVIIEMDGADGDEWDVDEVERDEDDLSPEWTL